MRIIMKGHMLFWVGKMEPVDTHFPTEYWLCKQLHGWLVWALKYALLKLVYKHYLQLFLQNLSKKPLYVGQENLWIRQFLIYPFPVLKSLWNVRLHRIWPLTLCWHDLFPPCYFPTSIKCPLSRKWRHYTDVCFLFNWIHACPLISPYGNYISHTILPSF